MISIKRDSIEVERFLEEISNQIRRRDIYILLSNIGISNIEIDNLLDSSEGAWTNVECSSTGRVIRGQSYGVNFLNQKRNAIMIWWEHVIRCNHIKSPSLLQQVSISFCFLVKDQIYVQARFRSRRRRERISLVTKPLKTQTRANVALEIWTPNNKSSSNSQSNKTPEAAKLEAILAPRAVAAWSSKLPEKLKLALLEISWIQIWLVFQLPYCICFRFISITYM